MAEVAGRAQPLLLGKGWQQVGPRAIGKKLLWESGGKLHLSDTDFSQPHVLGAVGRIDCPVAVDPVRRMAFRYTCPDQNGKDYSEIVAYHLDLGTRARIFALGLNQWMVWLLRHLPKEDVLIGLVATDMPGEGVRILHQLGLFDLKKSRSLLMPLPRDAFCPVDIHSGKREVLFHGAEGWQIIDYSGKRLAHLRSRNIPLGRGGALHPSRPLVAIGGGGIALWNRERNAIQQIHKQGQEPAWSPDGNHLYFSESSSDLFCHTLANGRTERILSIAGNKQAEITRARAPSMTDDGCHLALSLTRKIKRTGGDSKGLRFTYQHSLVIADLESRTLWQHPIEANHPVWYAPVDMAAAQGNNP